MNTQAKQTGRIALSAILIIFVIAFILLIRVPNLDAIFPNVNKSNSIFAIVILLMAVVICLIQIWKDTSKGKEVIKVCSYITLLLIWVSTISIASIPIFASLSKWAQSEFGVDKNSWLSYFGAALGSGITVIGAFIAAMIEKRINRERHSVLK